MVTAGGAEDTQRPVLETTCWVTGQMARLYPADIGLGSVNACQTGQTTTLHWRNVMNKRSQQRGFTLVEIAIVLVIIGLLLGGILKGQELIKSAQVRNLADQSAGTQAAYFGFVDRYRLFPGDMKFGNGPNQACSVLGVTRLPGCLTVGGDANGSLNVGDFIEASALWAHLQAAGFIQGAYAGTATSDVTYAGQAPTNPWGGHLLLGQSAGYLDAASPLAARIHLITGIQVPVGIMRELDLKIDDSLPATGVLRAQGAGNYGTVGTSTVTPACVTGTAPTSIWNIVGEQGNCNGYYLF